MFPQDDVSGDQPHIKFTIQKFRGPKFVPGSRQDFAAGNIKPAVGTPAATSGIGAPPGEMTYPYANNPSVGGRLPKYDSALSETRIDPNVIGPPFKTDNVASIRLFLPHQLNEAYALSWSQGDVGLGGQWYETGSAAVLKDLYEAGAVGSEVLGRLLGKATGSAAMKDLTLRNKGGAINPHMESFFKGVQFRKFTYNFQMFPRSVSESIQIRNIVRMFKMGAAPANLSGAAGYGRYWLYPNQFQIEYFNMEQTHKIKRCFLENIGVNYGAAGVNQTFKDKSPLQTDLTLNFTELELIQKEEIQEGY
jgi:hypothetical protein